MRNREKFDAWERAYIRSTPVDVQLNLRIMDAMYEEVRALGLLAREDPFEGIETLTRVVKTFHVPSPPRNDCNGP